MNHSFFTFLGFYLLCTALACCDFTLGVRGFGFDNHFSIWIFSHRVHHSALLAHLSAGFCWIVCCVQVLTALISSVHGTYNVAAAVTLSCTDAIKKELVKVS
jgi:hypothetical protein